MRSRRSYKIVLELHDLRECPLADVAIYPPGRERVALHEDLFDLFKRASGCLWKHEENVDECGEVEGAEDEIGLISNIGEARGDSPREGKIEQPVRRC